VAFEPGNRVGDYQIEQVLGAGGMGKVYKVRNLISDRVEAMKVLLPNLEGDHELADRFMREIKVQASLQHPNIAALHTAARIDNQLLMFMEFVEGTSIDRLIKNGPMPAQEVIRVIIAVLDALGYAHERGIIHRDIKPANIMLTPQGVVKLMDFGIARLASDPRVTQTGRTVGSLFYMSPEQINGKPLDARSDLYSLGISIYEMVTGRRPFDGDSDFSIMAAHLQQMPRPPIELDPRVPAPLNELILVSLAKNPDERFQSAVAFRNALASIASMVPNQAPAVEERTKPLSPSPVAGTPIPPQHATPAPQQMHAAPPQQGQMPQPPRPVVSTAPPPPPPGRPSSNRTLYMVAGSLATLAVIALAIWQGPKYFGAKAGQQEVVTPPTQSYQPPDPNGAGSGTTTTPSTGTPAGTASGTTAGTSLPPLGGGATGSTSQQPQVVIPSAGGRPPVTVTGGISTGVVQNSNPGSQAQSQQQPAITQQPPAQQQAVQQPPEQQYSRPAGPDPAVMNELRERYNSISIRAGAANEGVQRIEQQQAQMGVGLRGDIREARTRHSYQMREAQQYLQSGNVDGAKKALDYAERALEQIEKFLGR
jgi:serine/threonine-protein kinase